MIQSMTGYAAASADSPKGRLSVELRSVNSRFLDLQFRIADELRALEPMLRDLIAGRISRGKVDCRLFLNEIPGERRQSLNTQTLAQLKALGDEVLRTFPAAAPLRVADILRWPGVLGEPLSDDEALRDAVRRLCGQALDELVGARSREGAKLADAIRDRVAT